MVNSDSESISKRVRAKYFCNMEAFVAPLRRNLNLASLVCDVVFSDNYRRRSGAIFELVEDVESVAGDEALHENSICNVAINKSVFHTLILLAERDDGKFLC